MAGEEAPFLAQLNTPGTTTKLGSYSGTLAFDNTMEDSDVTGADLLWIRPSVVEAAGTTAAAQATQIYTAGWPGGIRLDGVGSRYDATLTPQAALGLAAAATATANAALVFSGGKLVDVVVIDAINITGGTVVKIPAANNAFTLSLTPSSGLFNGTFTPNWTNAAAVKPSFKGIILQKGGSKGGYGFFRSNRTGDTDPESGRATLGTPLR